MKWEKELKRKWNNKNEGKEIEQWQDLFFFSLFVDWMKVRFSCSQLWEFFFLFRAWEMCRRSTISHLRNLDPHGTESTRIICEILLVRKNKEKTNDFFFEKNRTWTIQWMWLHNYIYYIYILHIFFGVWICISPPDFLFVFFYFFIVFFFLFSFSAGVNVDYVICGVRKSNFSRQINPPLIPAFSFRFFFRRCFLYLC